MTERCVRVSIKRVQRGLREFDAIQVVIGDLHLSCDVTSDRDIRLAKSLADDHQAAFMYDDHNAGRVRAAIGLLNPEHWIALKESMS
jgi:hypothetical protein